MLACWQGDPAKRPTMKKLYEDLSNFGSDEMEAEYASYRLPTLPLLACHGHEERFKAAADIFACSLDLNFKQSKLTRLKL